MTDKPRFRGGVEAIVQALTPHAFAPDFFSYPEHGSKPITAKLLSQKSVIKALAEVDPNMSFAPKLMERALGQLAEVCEAAGSWKRGLEPSELPKFKASMSKRIRLALSHIKTCRSKHPKTRWLVRLFDRTPAKRPMKGTKARKLAKLKLARSVGKDSVLSSASSAVVASSSSGGGIKGRRVLRKLRKVKAAARAAMPLKAKKATKDPAKRGDDAGEWVIDFDFASQVAYKENVLTQERLTAPVDTLWIGKEECVVASFGRGDGPEVLCSVSPEEVRELQAHAAARGSANANFWLGISKSGSRVRVARLLGHSSEVSKV
jgi:hypothetical protein